MHEKESLERFAALAYGALLIVRECLPPDIAGEINSLLEVAPSEVAFMGMEEVLIAEEGQK